MKVHDIMMTTGARHICLTGGEPFLQNLYELEELVEHLLRRTGVTFDIFTNGSFIFPEWTEDQLVTLVMDWKLKGSGEQQTRQDERLNNAYNHMGPKDALKFTVTGLDDLNEAEDIWKSIRCEASVYVGRVWDAPLTNEDLVEQILERRLPWRLTCQVHKYIWPDKVRGI